jgi:hypothetical protein
METGPELTKTAGSAQHGHHLHYPRPTGSPEIGLGKRKWVVLTPSLGKLPSEFCLLRLYSFTPHKA